MKMVIVNSCSHKYYYLNGKLHRENGLELANGDKLWHLNGKLHREDGPALEFAHGDKEWYLNGKEFKVSSKEEFKRLINLKVFW